MTSCTGPALCPGGRSSCGLPQYHRQLQVVKYYGDSMAWIPSRIPVSHDSESLTEPSRWSRFVNLKAVTSLTPSRSTGNQIVLVQSLSEPDPTRSLPGRPWCNSFSNSNVTSPASCVANLPPQPMARFDVISSQEQNITTFPLAM